MSEQTYDAVTKVAVYNGGSYKKGGYFTTYTGVKFNPLDEDIWERINIKDIAHALSNCCRFCGHVSQFYSIAQHSVLVSYMCDPQDALAGLVHDATEAYLSDIVRPVKETELFENYRWLEKKLEGDVAKRFGIPTVMTPSVKAADMEIVIAEAELLFNPVPEWVTQYKEKYPLTLLDRLPEGPHSIRPWLPAVAKAKFLKRFFELSMNLAITYENQENQTK